MRSIYKRTSTSSSVRIRDHQARLLKKKFRVGKEDRAARRGKDAFGTRCRYPQVGG
ncbi:hypothetical protein Gotur_027359 [Gossypium turneri]